MSHGVLVGVEHEACYELLQRERQGLPVSDFRCDPMCWQTTDVVCLDPSLKHCDMIMECDCANPDTDPQWEGVDDCGHYDREQGFQWVFHEHTSESEKWRRAAYEQAVEAYEDRHDVGAGWESQGVCWVVCGDHWDWSYATGPVFAMPNLTPGWVEVDVDNEGSYEESQLVLIPTGLMAR